MDISRDIQKPTSPTSFEPSTSTKSKTNSIREKRQREQIDIKFSNIKVLAPMVRISKLPFRLVSLNHGADLVFTEEIICHKLVATVPIFNIKNQCTEFVTLRDDIRQMPTSSVDSILKKYKTHSLPISLSLDPPQYSRNQVVLSTNINDHPNGLQIGAPSAVHALASALHVLDPSYSSFDCIDINFGCPKPFSIKGGMGASLLEKPETIKDILSTLVRNINIPITAKVRILDTPEKTLELCKMIEMTGVSAVSIHTRKTPERPRVSPHWDFLDIVTSSLNIPVIGNGSLYEPIDFHKMKKHNVDSFMIARGAIRNPGIFLTPTPLVDESSESFMSRVSKIQYPSLESLIKEYYMISTTLDHSPSNIKYVINRMLGAQLIKKNNPFPKFNVWTPEQMHSAFMGQATELDQQQLSKS